MSEEKKNMFPIKMDNQMYSDEEENSLFNKDMRDKSPDIGKKYF